MSAEVCFTLSSPLPSFLLMSISTQTRMYLHEHDHSS
jgi:hypothetical protein